MGNPAYGRGVHYRDCSRWENITEYLVFTGLRRCLWVWGIYLVDYVKEDGEWRFWHMVFSPFFRTPDDKSWMEVPADDTLEPVR